MAGRAGRSGRRPQSAAHHALTGTYRGDRHGPKAPATGNVLPMPQASPARLPRPPAGLSVDARRLWRDVVSVWALDVAGLKLLMLACRALDDAAEARAAWKRDGSTIVMPSGARRQHPEVRREFEARAQFEKLIAALRLEDDETR